MKHRYRRWRSDQRGVMVIITAFCILVFLGLLGLAVDLGYLYATKAELQRSADAGAMAGAQALFPMSSPSSWPQCTQAQTQAQAIARANLVDSAAPAVATQTGRWDWNAAPGADGFNANCSSGTTTFTNAVRVMVSRSDVPLFFMGALGMDAIPQFSAVATGVMDFIGGVPPGTFPVAISTSTFNSVGYGKNFQIAFQTLDNGGWFVPRNYSANSSTLSNFINHTPPMPALNQGDTVNLNNGNTSALSDVYNQWVSHNKNWFVVLPVVPTNSFNGSQTISGFVGATITDVVNKKNQKYVNVTLSNASEIPGYKPGGVNFHALTSVKLVK